MFDGELPEEICITLPEGVPERIGEIYSERDSREKEITIENGKLHYVPREN